MGCAKLRESYVGERGAGRIYITPYRLCRAQIDLSVLLEFSVNVMRIRIRIRIRIYIFHHIDTS